MEIRGVIDWCTKIPHDTHLHARSLVIPNQND
jgi:hypothetical protein